MSFRVAVVFDNTQRPETTGFYCRRALADLVREGRIAEVEHLLPEELNSVEPGRFDLFVAIDDGLRYQWPTKLRPVAWWAIDTHLDFARTLERAWQSDFVFAAQKDGAERLGREGISGVKWLPLACDPAIHRPHSLVKKWDLAFVGHELPGERTRLLRIVRESFPHHFIGQRYLEEMAQTYSVARIVFNRSVKNDINMRVFEALACGSLLLTNDLTDNGQGQLFQSGIHLATYQSDEELIDQARFYLKHESHREQIAKAGLQQARSAHTYRHRMESLLEAVGKASHPVSKSLPVKDSAYYEFSRPDVLELIPQSACRVLDVGCGAGRLGVALKSRQAVEVVGIERNPQAAQRAREVLDAVVEIDLSDPNADYPPGPFEAIVCADVLEHIHQPRPVLERLRSLLTPDGTLVASLPNVQHHSVVRSLLAGNFSYEPAGLLDEDHKTFFTRREIEKLFFRAGFTIESITYCPDPAHQEWIAEGRLKTLRLGSLHIEGESPADIEAFYVYQYLITAKPAPKPQWGLTSIVIVTHNEWNYTRQCLESLRFHTDEPYELIVVDNGSSDGTVAWIKAQPDIRLIENAENRGYPAAVNQGLTFAQGQQVVLLNNDTLLTTGWLSRMLEALYQEPGIGMVGPCSNNVSGLQQIPVAYQDLAELDGFAWDHGRRHDGQMAFTDRLVGFCLLIRREVLDHIGNLDERFGIGCYEDDDFCRRAIAAGFRCVIAQNAFVHHFGSRTFLGSGVDLGQVLKDNRRVYEAKWSQTKPRLSLCMIVRDNERTIRPCLESIRPYVDEMIVVDTGSIDKTPDICREIGAKVFHFPWCDDFSAARNESLKHATGEWIFWMDSDDTIPAPCGRKLRILVDGEHPDGVLGYVMQVHCPSSEDDPHDVTIVDHVKLFPNRPDLRFEHRIHEQILPAIRRAGGEVAFTDIYVVHSGSEHTEEVHQRKLERDFRILKRDLAERPDHPFVLFNLGMTYADAGEHVEAVDYLKRSIEVATPGESHLHKAYALWVGSLTRLHRWAEADSTCQVGLKHFPEDIELWFRLGIVLHHQGRLTEAVEAYLQALEGSGERSFDSIDAGLGSFKTRHNLAIVYQEMGEAQRAEAEWRRVLDDYPDYRPAWRAFGDLLQKSGRIEEAWGVARELSQQPILADEGAILTAQLLEGQGDVDAARQILEQALKERDSVEVLRELCRMVFEHFGPAEAYIPLKELSDRAPDDASSHHNLGSVYLSQRDLPKAIEAFRRSLELRPHSPDTLVELAHALFEMGQVNKAQTTCQEALQQSPHHAGAKAALVEILNTHSSD